MNIIRRLNRGNFHFKTKFQILWLIRGMKAMKKYKIYAQHLKSWAKKHMDM